MCSPEQQQYIQDEFRKVDSIIAFAIEFLTVCEARKTWVKMPVPLSMTCGYTAPGIGILLQLFIPHNSIHDEPLAFFNNSLSTRFSIIKCLICSRVSDAGSGSLLVCADSEGVGGPRHTDLCL